MAEEFTVSEENYKKSLSAISSKIGDGRCIVILGPQFGENPDKRKVHEHIQNLITEQDKSVLFDEEFQNLHIIHDFVNKKYKRANIEDAIITSYDTYSKIHKYGYVYNQIAQLKFDSYINFTQDIFLPQAFKDIKQEYQYSYFSICGTLTQHENLDEKQEHIPLIYNLFGHYKHSESLIYTHDKYYQFLFSFLGNNLREEVSKRLAKGRIFLLVGFDLKKWYVPLLINKLCKTGRETTNDPPDVYAALNHSEFENNDAYIKWLKRYIPELEYLKDSGQLIDDLCKKESNLRNSAEEDTNQITKETKEIFIEATRDASEPKELNAILDDLKAKCQKIKDLDAVNRIGAIKQLLTQLIRQRTVQLINLTDHDIGFNNIRENTIIFIETSF
jgi:SIR2-like protein